jgi:AraC-like DNA-binding protein
VLFRSENKLFMTQQTLLGVLSPDFRKIISILEANLSLSLSEVAEVSGMSPRSLSRLAKSETGLTLHELHTYYRIKKAIGLMHAGEKGLLAIAFDCGYNSLSPFIENFKRWTGAKPSTFKAFL